MCDDTRNWRCFWHPTRVGIMRLLSITSIV